MDLLDVVEIALDSSGWLKWLYIVPSYIVLSPFLVIAYLHGLFILWREDKVNKIENVKF